MPPLSARNAGRDAVVAWALVAALVAVLVQIDIKLPGIGHLGSALIAVLFIYTPVAVAWWRREELEDYGFRWEPIARGTKLAALAIVAIFPLFVVGYFAFYEIACHSDLLANLVPRGMCGRYGGLDSLHVPDLAWLSPPIPNALSAEFVAVQLVVVALPEELFFRGLLLGLLERRFPPKLRVWGGGIGIALVLSSLAFALIHLPKDGDPRALATFVPGLLFGWMRSATGSIYASTLTHAASNILVRTLELAVMR